MTCCAPSGNPPSGGLKMNLGNDYVSFPVSFCLLIQLQLLGLSLYSLRLSQVETACGGKSVSVCVRWCLGGYEETKNEVKRRIW